MSKEDKLITMTNKSRQKIWSATDILLMAPKKGAHYNYSNSEWPQVPTYFLEFYYDILGNTEVKKNCTIRRIVIGN